MNRSGNKNKGEKHNRFVHGMTDSREHKCWASMLARCNNPNNKSYKNYGARGIKVCDRWHSFKEFYEDMGPRPEGMSIERKDNDLGYSPENCVWATRFTQSRNRRFVKLSLEIVEQICELRRSGMTYEKIASQFQCSKSQVFRVCHNDSWTSERESVLFSRPSRSYKLDSEKVALAFAMGAQGKSQAFIAEVLGVNQSTIHRVFKMANGPRE